MPNVAYRDTPPLIEVITDIKNELRDFVQTRLRLAASELSEAAGSAMNSLLMGVVSVLLTGIGLLWLAFGLTAVIAAGFSDWRMGIPVAFGIVGVVLLAIGASLLLSIRASLRTKVLLPRKTFDILKSDAQMWYQDGKHLYE